MKWTNRLIMTALGLTVAAAANAQSTRGDDVEAADRRGVDTAAAGTPSAREVGTSSREVGTARAGKDETAGADRGETAAADRGETAAADRGETAA
ncbi:MAG: hypothetical protein JXB36_20490, partial [Gammaproteobacteria bacterium]|nr:hypothetical protein [Gammaproteobacteria bacterium]